MAERLGLELEKRPLTVPMSVRATALLCPMMMTAVLSGPMPQSMPDTTGEGSACTTGVTSKAWRNARRLIARGTP